MSVPILKSFEDIGHLARKIDVFRGPTRIPWSFIEDCLVTLLGGHDAQIAHIPRLSSNQGFGNDIWPILTEEIDTLVLTRHATYRSIIKSART